MSIVSIHEDSNKHEIIEGAAPPHIKSGVYDLVFDFYETVLLLGRAPKLVLWFRIANEGESFGTRLPRYYNVKRIIGKPRRSGDFRIGWKADFIREYVSLFGMPQRLDRIAMGGFKNHLIRGKVKTVTNDLRQRDIPEPLRYSVIQELRGIKKL